MKRTNTAKYRKQLDTTQLRIELAKRNWTKSDLAKKLNISKQNLNYHIITKNLYHIHDISKALRINPSTLTELVEI